MKVRTWSRVGGAIAAGLLFFSFAGSAAAQELPLPPELPLPGEVRDQAPMAATAAPVAPAGAPLNGTLKITAGQCGDAGVTSGSYFRMVNPGGSAAEGPYTGNSSSPCGESSWTPLTPGTEGGLSTAHYQPHPDPAFQGSGGAAADRIIAPTPFNGVGFSIATSAVDPQTKAEVPVPSVANDGGTLSGDLRAIGAAWNRMHFNQGAPKPDGSAEGNTAAPHGSYDAETGKVICEWASQIAGGPFDGFTGVWHLEGTVGR